MGNKLFIIFFGIIFIQSCNTNKYLPAFDYKLFNNSPVQELAKAVEQENTEKINDILKDKTINVDYQEPKYGHTLLMLSVANNKIKSIHTLLSNNANPNLTSNNNQDNSVSIAVENYPEICDTTILTQLFEYGANANFIQDIDRVEDNGMHSIVKRSILMIAVRNDCSPIVKFLVNNGANINEYTYYNGYGAITESIIHNNLIITKYLIIEKHAYVPTFCYVRNKGETDEERLTITDLLNEAQYDEGTENYELREEIIRYLKSKNL